VLKEDVGEVGGVGLCLGTGTEVRCLKCAVSVWAWGMIVPWDQNAGSTFDVKVTKGLVAENVLQRLAFTSADTKTL